MERLPADEVKRLLVSDKVTERKKGAAACEKLLMLDKEHEVITSSEWCSICRGVMAYEKKEIANVRSKNKTVLAEYSQFLKRVVKHCVAQSQLTGSIVKALFKHALQSLGATNPALPPSSQAEHKQILCNLLEIRVAHLLPTYEISEVAAYLQQRAMCDKRGVTDSANQKLLKGVARTLFSEFEGGVGVAIGVVEWVCSKGELFEKVSADMPAEATLTILIAECLTLLIEYHGASLCNALFTYASIPLQMCIKLLGKTSQTNRDAHRDPCLRFLFAYLHLSTGCHFSLSAPLCSTDPMIRILPRIYEELASDDCLRTLVLQATNVSMRQNRDLFVNVLDDSKCRLHFEVAAVSLCLQQLLSGPIARALLEESDEAKEDDANSTNKAKRQKVSHSSTQREVSSSSISNSSDRPIQSLLKRIQGLSATSQRSARPNPPSKAATAARGQTQTGTQIATQTQQASQMGPPSTHYTQHSSAYTQAQVSSSSMAMGSSTIIGRQQPSVVYEGMLWLIATLARLFPRGEFLLMDTDCQRDVLTRSARIASLSEWLRTLRHKAAEILQIDEMQIHGAMLVALRALARVSCVLLHSQSDGASLSYAFNQDESAAPSARLRWEWGEVVRLLFSSSRIRSYCASSCRKASVAEALYGLFETIVELDLLDPGIQTSFQQQLWTLPSMLDPRLVASSACFSLISALSVSQLEGTPTLGRSYLQQLMQADVEFMAVVDDDAPSSSNSSSSSSRNGNSSSTNSATPPPKIKMTELLSFDLQGPVLCAAYVACFLDYQLDAPPAARITLQVCPDFVASIAKLLNSTIRNDEASSTRETLRMAALTTQLGCNYPLTFQQVGEGCTSAGSWFDRPCTDDNEEAMCHMLGSNLLLRRSGAVGLDVTPRQQDAGSADFLTSSVAISLSDPSRQAYRSTAQRSLQVLELFCVRLLAKDLVQANTRAESAEVSTWQLLLLLLSSCYVAIVENLERHLSDRASEINAAISAGVSVTEQQKLDDKTHADDCFQVALQAMLKFWMVCQVHLKTLTRSGSSTFKVESNLRRAHHIKASILADYMQMWCVLFRRVAASKLFHFDVEGEVAAASDSGSTTCRADADNIFGSFDSILRPAAIFSPQQSRDINSVRQVRIDCSAELLVLAKLVRDLAIPEQDASQGQSNKVDDDMDLDDIALPASSSSSSNAVKGKGQHGQMMQQDDDDDDDVGPWEDNPKPVDGQRSKISFSHDQLRLFISLANCYFICITTDVKDHIYEDRLDLLMKVLKEREVSQLKTIPVWTPTDVALAVAESLASTIAASCSHVSCYPWMRYLCEFSWDIEWGNIGFYKTLCIIHDLTRRKQFYLSTEEKDDKCMHFCVDFILSEKALLREFPSTFWRVRWMQVECIANLLRFHRSYSSFAESPRGRSWLSSLNSRGLKLFALCLDDKAVDNTTFIDKIKMMLMQDVVAENGEVLRSAYICDSDVRVRKATGRAFPLLLLSRWKSKTLIIYRNLLSATEVSVLALASVHDRPQRRGILEPDGEAVMEFAGNVEDPQRIISAALALAHVGVKSPTILPHALLDLCKLCCSRSAQHRSESGVPLPDYSSLLTRLLLYMSRELGYASPETMLADHLRFLLHEWIEPVAPRNAGADAMDEEKIDEPPRVLLSLSDFPYQAMRLTGTYTYQDFLLEHGTIILPIVCQVSDSAARWKIAQEVARNSGYGVSDAGMATLFSHFSSAIWGAEFPLALVQQQLQRQADNSKEVRDGRLIGTEMSAFLTRIVMAATIQHRLAIQSASDMLQGHLLGYAEMSLDEESRAIARVKADETALAPEAGHWLPAVPLRSTQRHIVCLAADMASRKTDKRHAITNEANLKVFKEEFLQREVNILEILASLRRRILDTRLETVRLNVLASLTAIARHDKYPTISSMRALISVALCAVQTSSHHGVVISACRFFALLADRWNDRHVDNEALDSMGELFCELVGLCTAFGQCLHRLNRADVGNGEEGGCDDFASAAYSSIILASREAAVSAQADVQKEWRSELMACREIVFSAMCTLIGTAHNISTGQRGTNKSIRGALNNPILRCLPVPRIYFSSLSAEIRVMLADFESVENSEKFDFNWRLRDFTLLSRQIQAGAAIGFMTMWCKMLGIFDNLQREERKLGASSSSGAAGGAMDVEGRESDRAGDEGDLSDTARDSSLWALHPNLTASFVSSMIRLSECFSVGPPSPSSAAQSAAYQQKIMQVLGHLGPPDLHSIHHSGANGLSFDASGLDLSDFHLTGKTGRIPTIEPTADPSTLEFEDGAPTVPARKASLIGMIIGMLWQDSHASAVASAALRLLAANKIFDEDETLEAADTLGLQFVMHVYRTVPLACRSQEHAPLPKIEAGGLLSAAAKSKILDRPPPEDPWSKNLWSTANKTYSAWITRLVPVLLKNFCAGVARSFMGPLGGVYLLPDVLESGALDAPPVPPVGSPGCKNLTKFLAALVEVCMLRHQVATAVFPLILHDMLTAGPHVHETKGKLSEALTGHLLTPQCSLPEATRLACTTLVFLLRQEIYIWRKVSFAAKPKKGKKGTEAAKSAILGGLHRSLPFSHGLDIDYVFAAYAAERSGCVCTALLFAELAEEDRRAGRTPSSGGAMMPRNSLSGSGAAAGSFSNNKSGATAISAISNPDLFIRVFRHMHDPDAILGMMHAASDLDVQALMYAHNGSWVEALATYESLVAQAEGKSYGEGSGSSARRAQGALVPAPTGIVQSLRGLGAQHALSAYAASVSGVFSDDCGTGRGYDETLVGGAENGNSAHHPQGKSAGRAAEGLRAWSPSVVSLANGGMGTASGGGNGSAMSHLLSSPSQRTLMHSTFAGLTSSSALNSTDLFNNCLSSAVADIQRNDLPSAQRRTRACASRLFPRIAEALQHETACNLLPDLVRVQQLVEVVEAGTVMMSSTKIIAWEGDESEGRSKIQRMLSCWRGRLRGSTTSATALVHNEALLSFRLSLVSQLLQSGRARPSECIGLMMQVHDVGTTKSAVHALSPLVYRLKTALMQSPNRDDGAHFGQQGMRPLWKVDWQMYEGRLLWKKGLHSVALDCLDEVIALIHDMGRSLPPSISHTTNGAVTPAASITASLLRSASRRARLENLLSEAYVTCGEWVSARRTAMGGDILHDYFLPAVQTATTDVRKIKAALTLASFYERLFQQVKAKRASQEWAQFLRNNLDRQREHEQCVQYRQQKNKPVRLSTKEAQDRPPTAEELAAIKEDDDLKRHLRTLKSELDLDEAERRRVEEAEGTYLYGALQHYGDVLALSPEADVEVVFRVVNLWLSHRADGEVNDALNRIVSRTASFKFVPLTYQILSRLGGSVAFAAPTPSASFSSSSSSAAAAGAGAGAATSKSSSKSPRNRTATPTHDPNASIVSSGSGGKDSQGQSYLTFPRVQRNLILKLASEHPHHVLPQLLALINTDPIVGDVRPTATQAHSSRADAASQILLILRGGPGSSDQTRALLAGVEVMLQAYIQLASTNTSKQVSEGRLNDISFREIQGRHDAFDITWADAAALRLAQQIPSSSAAFTATATATASSSSTPSSAASSRPVVLTHPLRIAADGDYSLAPRVLKFHSKLSLTESGISHPKIIKCDADDGRTYKQLVKGGDDMRQDAVMQQVFENVNYTLSRVGETRKRSLHIRTYKIVPLTPQTGVIEYVENTEPFGHYLTHAGSNCAHARYYPQDWTNSDCRAHMTAGVDARDKEARFREVMSNFHPVFRFFFLEKYPDPARWVNCRRAYTQSVAVNSIVGYVLGIGDRHSHNIMVDSTTAEVVHIDFGIVFEQGRILNTPETVPFRLTRDIVDGMGATGTEGSFRRSSEEVLRVLRDNTMQLMTILEVVLHDPLYKWSLSPLQARAKQQEKGDNRGVQGGQNAGEAGGGHGAGRGHTAGTLCDDGTLSGRAGGSIEPPAPAPEPSHARSARSHAQHAQATIHNTSTNANSNNPNDADNFGDGHEGLESGGGYGRDIAERTLLRIRSKLQGFEDPSGECLGVEGQVELVTQMAKDPRNLAKLFPGWGAWV